MLPSMPSGSHTRETSKPIGRGEPQPSSTTDNRAVAVVEPVVSVSGEQIRSDSFSSSMSRDVIRLNAQLADRTSECRTLRQTLQQREQLMKRILGAFGLAGSESLDSTGLSEADEACCLNLIEVAKDNPPLQQLVCRLLQNQRNGVEDSFTVHFASESRPLEPEASLRARFLSSNDECEGAQRQTKEQELEALRQRSFKELSVSDETLKADIAKYNDEFSKIKTKKNVLAFLVDKLNQEGSEVPDWDEVFPQEEWSEALVQYAAFRLQEAGAKGKNCLFLDLLKKDTEQYLYVLVSIVAETFPKPVGASKHPLFRVPIPLLDRFKSLNSPTCTMGHTDYCRWLLEPDSPVINGDRAMGIARILNHESLDYQQVLVLYVLKKLEKNWPKFGTKLVLNHAEKELLAKAASLFKGNQFPFPPALKERSSESHWNKQAIIDLLVLENITLAEDDSIARVRDDCNIFGTLHRAKDDDDAYQSALQACLEGGNSRLLSSYNKGHKNWTLREIKGTSVGDAPVTIPKVLLSGIYYLGFGALTQDQVLQQKKPILRLLTSWDENKELNKIIRQLIIFQFSSLPKGHRTHFMDSIKASLSGVYPHAEQLTIKDIEQWREEVPPFTWKDGTQAYTQQGSSQPQKKGKVGASQSSGKKRSLTDSKEPPPKRTRKAKGSTTGKGNGKKAVNKTPIFSFVSSSDSESD